MKERYSIEERYCIFKLDDCKGIIVRCGLCEMAVEIPPKKLSEAHDRVAAIQRQVSGDSVTELCPWCNKGPTADPVKMRHVVASLAALQKAAKDSKVTVEFVLPVGPR